MKAARVWHILPKHVNIQNTLDSFKVALGEMVLNFSDKPAQLCRSGTVVGYTPHNKSLLDRMTVGGFGVCDK